MKLIPLNLFKLILFVTLPVTLILGSTSQAQDTDPKILFLSDHEGDVGLYTMNADGTNVQRFIDVEFEEGGEITDASLSPDGTMLAVSSRKDRLDHPTNEIFLFDLRTGVITQLTNDGKENTSPVWSPNSRYLGFLGDGIYGLFENVYIFDRETQSTQVATTGTQLSSILDNDFGTGMSIKWFDWAPDSNRLALAGEAPFEGTIEAYNVLVVTDINGAEAHQITPNERDVFLASWKFNSDFIYTTCFANDHDEICRVDVQTSHIDVLTNLRSSIPDAPSPFITSLDISPESEIVFSYGDYVNPSIYKYDIDTNTVTQIVAGDTTEYQLIGWINPIACSATVPASDTTALINTITAANSAGSPQTICLEQGTYTLTASNNSDANQMMALLRLR